MDYYLDYLFVYLVKFPLIVLATWRLSSMLANEDGPFDMFKRIRIALGASAITHDSHWIARGLICIWCNSVWISFGMALLLINPDIIWYFINTFAISAAVIAFDNKLGG